MLRDGTDRHGRMLEGDYDVAEFSLSSFLIARDKGLPIVGIPIFPRRLFSMSQMWVHPDSPYRKPSDLIGKKVVKDRVFDTKSHTKPYRFGFTFCVLLFAFRVFLFVFGCIFIA